MAVSFAAVNWSTKPSPTRELAGKKLEEAGQIVRQTHVPSSFCRRTCSAGELMPANDTVTDFYIIIFAHRLIITKQSSPLIDKCESVK